jgi:hypothetical protein
MNRFAPLFSQIVDSSVWQEPDHVRIVFITMLAKKDSDHVVRATAFNIARWANKTEKEVLDAFRVLSSPDKRRLEPQEYDGRRIQKVEDGWLILNGDKYEKMMKKLAEQARKAKWARENRAKKSGKATGGVGSAGARVYEEAIKRGSAEDVQRAEANGGVEQGGPPWASGLGD